MTVEITNEMKAVAAAKLMDCGFLPGRPVGTVKYWAGEVLAAALAVAPSDPGEVASQPQAEHTPEHINDRFIRLEKRLLETMERNFATLNRKLHDHTHPGGDTNHTHVPPHKSLNERVAALEAVVRSNGNTDAIIFEEMDKRLRKIESELEEASNLVAFVDQNLGSHRHLPKGEVVFDFEDEYPGDDADVPAQPADAGGEDALWEQVALAARQQGMGTYYTSNHHAVPIVKAAIAKAVELGLVSRREPVVVTGEDVTAAIAAYDTMPSDADFGDEVRAMLQCFADRLNGGDR